jgi:hypothetical protein
MPYDSHRSRMQRANTKRRAPRVHSVTEEPPIACFHPVEEFLLDPACSFSGATGMRLAPEHPEYRSIESCENTLGDDMAVVVGPSPYNLTIGFNRLIRR